MRSILPLTLPILLTCAAAWGQSHEDLLAMLRSGDPHQRAVARQLLPRHGADQIDDVIAVLGRPDEAVWRTASNVLSDVANELSVPGREDERRRFAVALLTRLESQPPRDEAARLLNIVHLALPEGVGVEPIARYLSDASLRVNARDALQLAATTESKAALRNALPSADADFALALIDALRLLRDPDAHDVLFARLDDPDTSVRVAAARALAWTGDISLVPAFRRLIRSVPEDQHVAAGDAYLLLADAVTANGGKYDRAMELYAWAARELNGPILRGAAIASMGRMGDERVVPIILDALRNAPKGALDHAALEALAVLPGETVSRAIHTHHDALLHRLGPSLYGVYGRRGDARFTPILTEAVESGDSYAQHVAALALLDAAQPDGVAAVARYARTLDGPERGQLVTALELLAVACRRDGRADTAGAAYAGLYRLASSDEARQFALDGMMRYPSEEAFAIVKDLIGDKDLASFSVAFLSGIARSLLDAGRNDDANRVLDTLVARVRTADEVRAFMQSAHGAGLASRLGFILDWHVIGPFPWSAADAFGESYVDAPDVDLAKTFSIKGETRAWKSARGSAADGVLNLIGAVGNHANAAAYAYAEVNVPEQTDAELRLGSDDGIKVWLNGDVVHENHVDRGLLPDQDRAPIALRTGTNRILIEITQGGGGWALCARLTTRDGEALRFTQ